MKVVDLARSGQRWTFAQFPQACAELGVNPRHVLHVGGHLGQEYPHYKAAGAERVTFMEPTPASAEYLRATYPDATVIEAAAGSEPGSATLLLNGGDGCWNSLSPAATSIPHDGAGGQIEVRVVTVAGVQGDADVLVVDTQGTEVEALAGADLSRVRLVVVETQSTGHPEAAHVDDVTAHMAARGWAPVLAWSHEPSGPYHGFADVFYVPMQQPTWTVCIATIGQRRRSFARLLDGLLPQVAAADGRVKVLACWDNGEATIAEKRQALVEAVDTDYISFIDDDDTVTDDYVSAILEALQTRPDFVGLWMEVHKNGRKHRLAELSLKHDRWFDGPEHYCRDITHENPMRTDIVKTVDFRDKPDGEPEDTPWAAKLRGKLKTEVMVDRVLYHYWWVPAESAWGKNARVSATDSRGRRHHRLPVDSPHFAYVTVP